jgi:hypothetical protein
MPAGVEPPLPAHLPTANVNYCCNPYQNGSNYLDNVANLDFFGDDLMLITR